MKKPVLALFSPNENRYTETFVQAHRRLLDADIRYIYGGWMPQFTEKNGPLVGQSILAKIGRRLEKFLLPGGRLNRHEQAIVRFLKEEKVEVALAEYGVTAAKVCRACQAAGVPLIVHFHGFDAHMHATIREMKDLYPKLFSYARYIIGVSRFMCAQLEKLGAPPEKIVYAPYGPNEAFFEITPRFSTRTFVFIGRFIPKKSPETLLKAFARAVARYPDLRLRMGGDGALLQASQALAKELNLADKIEFAGSISHQQVIDWYSEALAMVLHSVTAPSGDTEGTPLVVLEASAAGLPVISTRHAGIPDVILEEKTGILVDEHDLDGFAEAMIRIAENEDLAKAMGAAGRAYIAANFSMKHHIGIIDGLIRKSLPHSI